MSLDGIPDLVNSSQIHEMFVNGNGCFVGFISDLLDSWQTLVFRHLFWKWDVCKLTAVVGRSKNDVKELLAKNARSTCATPTRYFNIYTFIWFLHGFFRVPLGFL